MPTLPFQPAPFICNVTMHFSLDGQEVNNVYNCAVPDPFTTSDQSGLCEVFSDWWVASMKPISSIDIGLNKITAYDAAVEGGAGVTYTIGLPVLGQRTVDAVSNNVAFCVTLQSAGRGRSARGRSYVAGIPEDKVTRSHIDNVLRADIVAAYNSLIGLLQTNGTPLAIVSRYHLNLRRAEATHVLVETATSYDDVLDSQRRRLPGRGN